jgi:hypothetical protein
MTIMPAPSEFFPARPPGLPLLALRPSVPAGLLPNSGTRSNREAGLRMVPLNSAIPVESPASWSDILRYVPDVEVVASDDLWREVRVRLTAALKKYEE